VTLPAVCDVEPTTVIVLLVGSTSEITDAVPSAPVPAVLTNTIPTANVSTDTEVIVLVVADDVIVPVTPLIAARSSLPSFKFVKLESTSWYVNGVPLSTLVRMYAII
jgi:hypothetical protein